MVWWAGTKISEELTEGVDILRVVSNNLVMLLPFVVRTNKNGALAVTNKWFYLSVYSVFGPDRPSSGTLEKCTNCVRLLTNYSYNLCISSIMT
jgi:hypothetical protein